MKCRFFIFITKLDKVYSDFLSNYVDELFGYVGVIKRTSQKGPRLRYLLTTGVTSAQVTDGLHLRSSTISVTLYP